MSRPIAEYIAKNHERLPVYVLEDASIGIWLDEAPFREQIKWIRFDDRQWWIRKRKRLKWGDKYRRGSALLGHNVGPDEMKECFQVYSACLYEPNSIGEFFLC